MIVIIPCGLRPKQLRCPANASHLTKFLGRGSSLPAFLLSHDDPNPTLKVISLPFHWSFYRQYPAGLVETPSPGLTFVVTA